MTNLWIQHLEIKNGRTKMADQKLKKIYICIKFSTPRFSWSQMLKLEMQKYRKILVW